MTQRGSDAVEMMGYTICKPEDELTNQYIFLKNWVLRAYWVHV